jgi:enoyl-CoA hydratase
MSSSSRAVDVPPAPRGLLLERRGPVALITVNRADKHNALDRATLVELDGCVAALAADPAVRALVITGAGEKSFVAGADIAELAALDAVGAHAISRLGQGVFDRIAAFPQPVIAAVNGFAFGGGCELALACHVRYAAQNARLGLPEVKLGAMPGYGGTQRLARVVGLGRAVELMATGDYVDAEEAYRIGLVNRVLPPGELVPACVALGEKIAAHAPLAVAGALEAAVRGGEMALADGLALEAARFGVLGATHDWHEGMEAFLQKRKPEFRGR